MLFIMMEKVTNFIITSLFIKLITYNYILILIPLLNNKKHKQKTDKQSTRQGYTLYAVEFMQSIN